MIVAMTNLLDEAVGLIIGDTTTNLYMYEDIYVSFIITETLLPQFTP